MQPKKRNLADELAELANPAPAARDEDPEENFEFGIEARRLYLRDNDEEPTHRQASARIAPESGLLLRGGLEMQGEVYAGRASSRRATLGGEDAESLDPVTALRSSSAPEPVLSDGYSDDDQFEPRGQSKEEDEDEMAALGREYQQLREEEEEVLRGVQHPKGADAAKGLAVAHQRALWERALEMRISLQKVLGGACRLPHPAAQKYICSRSKDSAAAFSDTAKSARQSLSLLSELMEELEMNNSAISAAYEASVNANGKREREVDAEEAENDSSGPEAIWQKLDGINSRLAPFCGSAIDRWQRKTMLSLGAAAGKARLRALNQSVTQQVATALRDPLRLIARTRLRPSALSILGQPSFGGRDPAKGIPNDTLDHQMDSESVDEEGDPETYDDADFYQQLLREFLEFVDPDSLGGMSLYAVRKLRNNKKKLVDRRASKGRKIRYTVLQPLVNFMAPEPMKLPPMAEKLFLTLFGQAS